MLNIAHDVYFKDRIFFPMSSPHWGELSTGEINTTLIAICERFQGSFSRGKVNLFRGKHKNTYHYIQEISHEERRKNLTPNLVGRLYFIYELLLPKKEQVDELLMDEKYHRVNDWWRLCEEVYKSLGLKGALYSLPEMEFPSICDGRHRPKKKFVLDFFLDRFICQLLSLVLEVYPEAESRFDELIEHVVAMTYVEWKQDDYKFLVGYKEGPLTFMQKLQYLSKEGPGSPYWYAPYAEKKEPPSPSSDYYAFLFVEFFLAEVCMEMMKQEYGRSEVSKEIDNAK